MRKSKYSVKEQTEMEEAKAKDVRKGGLSLVSVRDRGWGRLNNGMIVQWHTNSPLVNKFHYDGAKWEITDGNIEDGKFMIKTPERNIVFDAEDLMRFLRWA